MTGRNDGAERGGGGGDPTETALEGVASNWMTPQNGSRGSSASFLGVTKWHSGTGWRSRAEANPGLPAAFNHLEDPSARAKVHSTNWEGTYARAKVHSTNLEGIYARAKVHSTNLEGTFARAKVHSTNLEGIYARAKVHSTNLEGTFALANALSRSWTGYPGVQRGLLKRRGRQDCRRGSQRGFSMGFPSGPSLTPPAEGSRATGADGFTTCRPGAPTGPAQLHP